MVKMLHGHHLMVFLFLITAATGAWRSGWIRSGKDHTGISSLNVILLLMLMQLNYWFVLKQSHFKHQITCYSLPGLCFQGFYQAYPRLAENTNTDIVVWIVKIFVPAWRPLLEGKRPVWISFLDQIILKVNILIHSQVLLPTSATKGKGEIHII